ncbi:5515_t:CDS:1, partial [Dentiscutata heterogama]
MTILELFTETIERLERSQYSTISYVYPVIQKIKTRLSVFFDPIDEDNNNQDELKNVFDELQIKYNVKDEPKIKQKIKINRPINMFGLIDMIK